MITACANPTAAAQGTLFLHGGFLLPCYHGEPIRHRILLQPPARSTLRTPALVFRPQAGLTCDWVILSFSLTHAASPQTQAP